MSIYTPQQQAEIAALHTEIAALEDKVTHSSALLRLLNASLLEKLKQLNDLLNTKQPNQ